MNVKKIIVKCLSCGFEYKIKVTEIKEDKFGKFVECKNCGATFDIDEK